MQLALMLMVGALNAASCVENYTVSQFIQTSLMNDVNLKVLQNAFYPSYNVQPDHVTFIITVIKVSRWWSKRGLTRPEYSLLEFKEDKSKYDLLTFISTHPINYTIALFDRLSYRLFWVMTSLQDVFSEKETKYFLYFDSTGVKLQPEPRDGNEFLLELEQQLSWVR